MILETLDGENYLEFILLMKEVNAIASSKMASMVGEIDGNTYQICVRLAIPSEISEIFEIFETKKTEGIEIALDTK